MIEVLLLLLALQDVPGNSVILRRKSDEKSLRSPQFVRISPTRGRIVDQDRFRLELEDREGEWIALDEKTGVVYYNEPPGGFRLYGPVGSAKIVNGRLTGQYSGGLGRGEIPWDLDVDLAVTEEARAPDPPPAPSGAKVAARKFFGVIAVVSGLVLFFIRLWVAFLTWPAHRPLALCIYFGLAPLADLFAFLFFEDDTRRAFIPWLIAAGTFLASGGLYLWLGGG